MICGIFHKIFGRKKARTVITSFEALSLRVSGMRGQVIYEITENDGSFVLTLYRMTADEKRPEKTVACDRGDMLDLLNSCGVMDWMGFHGEHPRVVLDGDMFDFSATVNGGVVIKADGSAKFPNGYRELVSGLVDLLSSFE